MTFRRVVVSLRGPGRSPVLPFACCVGSLCSVGRCGRCSCRVSFPRSQSPVVGVPGLCWMWRDVPFACQRLPVVGVLGVVLVVAGVVSLLSLSTRLCPQAVHSLPRSVSVCVRPRCPAPPAVCGRSNASLAQPSSRAPGTLMLSAFHPSTTVRAMSSTRVSWAASDSATIAGPLPAMICSLTSPKHSSRTARAQCRPASWACGRAGAGGGRVREGARAPQGGAWGGPAGRVNPASDVGGPY